MIRSSPSPPPPASHEHPPVEDVRGREVATVIEHLEGIAWTLRRMLFVLHLLLWVLVGCIVGFAFILGERLFFLSPR